MNKNSTPISHEIQLVFTDARDIQVSNSRVVECVGRETDNAPLTYASMSSVSNIIYQGQLSGPCLTWANPYQSHKYTNPYAYTQTGWDRMAMITFNIYSCLNYKFS